MWDINRKQQTNKFIDTDNSMKVTRWKEEWEEDEKGKGGQNVW